MTIKRKLKRYNEETGCREECIDDSKEFHSFHEVKGYCIDYLFNHLSFRDNIMSTFIILDTNEEIRIIGHSIEKDNGEISVILEYDL